MQVCNMITQVTLDAATRKKDRSVNLRFITNLEQTSEQFIEMDSLINQSGILYFSPKGTLTQEEIDAIDGTDIEIEGKTKSQRLRNVLYVYCEQQGKDFKTFYEIEMLKIIEHYKGKLYD